LFASGEIGAGGSTDGGSAGGSGGPIGSLPASGSDFEPARDGT
jgi:hypothetical protein